jgi:hypothetical protein
VAVPSDADERGGVVAGMATEQDRQGPAEEAADGDGTEAEESSARGEAGRNVQTAAMDMLLRMIRDLPGSLDYLKKHAA